MEISVIIPMYNAEKTIVRALESVRNQTYKAHYQIIVVNDGSTDRSLQVVNRYMQEHPEMDITAIDKPNGGVSSARNTGFRQATGQWIALLDSDDQWLPNKMEVQMKILEEHPEIDFIGSSIIGQHIRILWRLKDKLSPIKVWELFIRWHPWTPTCVFRRTILQDVGFYNESMHYMHAEELLVHAGAVGFLRRGETGIRPQRIVGKFERDATRTRGDHKVCVSAWCHQWHPKSIVFGL